MFMPSDAGRKPPVCLAFAGPHSRPRHASKPHAIGMRMQGAAGATAAAIGRRLQERRARQTIARAAKRLSPGNRSTARAEPSRQPHWRQRRVNSRSTHVSRRASQGCRAAAPPGSAPAAPARPDPPARTAATTISARARRREARFNPALRSGGCHARHHPPAPTVRPYSGRHAWRSAGRTSAGRSA